jgi:tRNA/rRNA methyltransferase
MNLGQAVAICLYELRRDAQAVAHRFEPAPTATAESSERLTGLLLDILNRSGYVNEKTAESAELKLRRLVRRLGLPASDVETWLGIFRQILWKVKQ